MRGIVLVLCTVLAGTAARAQLSSDAIEVTYDSGAGTTFKLRGVPIIRGSSIQFHDPDWKEGYYSSNARPPKPQVDESARRIVVRHQTEKKILLDATETIQLVGKNRIEITLAGRMDSPVEANLEWAIGYVNVFAFYDGSYRDLTHGAAPVGVERVPPIAGDKPEVVTGAHAIEMASPAGMMRVKLASGDAMLSLLDGRRASGRWWAQESPSFWLGCQNVKIIPGRPFEYRVAIEFEPPPLRESLATVSAAVKPIPLDPAVEPTSRPVRVIPTPTRMEMKRGAFIIRPDERIFGNQSSEAAAKRFSETVNRELKLQTRAIGPADFTEGVDSPRFDVLLDRDCKPEAYLIRASGEAVQVFAADDAGFRYAAQTLLQLARLDAQGRWTVPACEIDDQPSLAFRGIHLFPGNDALDLHRKLIENVFARFKINHVVLECEYTQWDSARGIWTDISVPKDQIAQYVKLLRENGIEPIPLVSSLGHAAWMFKNGQNLDIAEDPDEQYAYDATNPKSHAFMDAIYEEAIELFRAKYFHIGHDEVALFGRYPNRDQSKQWGITKLFLHDVAHWDEFLKKRNMQMMLWGDMMLARDEIEDGAAMAQSIEAARERREQLPKDAIVCDWHYDAKEPLQYVSLKIFKDAGFSRVIACSWFNPQNIYALAQAARKYGAWGLLQTTWAGYNVNEDALDREYKQFAAYILAAEYAWSANSSPPAKLPWRADEILARALNPAMDVQRALPGFAVDLSQLTNASSPLASPDQAIVLDGALQPDHKPRTVRMQFRAPASHLIFLHATSSPALPGEIVGAYDVRYEDGSVARIDLRYARQIRAWDEPGPAREAVPVRPNDRVTVYRYTWSNPHPDRTIVGIDFSTDHAYAAPFLLSVTGLAER